MFTWRRAAALVALLAVAIAAYSVWLAWRTERDLRAAEDAVIRLQVAVELGDDTARSRALTDLKAAAGSARDRTSGFWWGAMSTAPFYGDDVKGVEALSASIDLIATDAVAPLIETVDSLDGVVAGGVIDPVVIASLDGPITRASQATREAMDLVGQHDSDGFVSALRTRYDDYVDRVGEVAAGFAGAETAVDVLPGILGADGPRDYLLIFQNNAEIRSTGGLPGSWARVHVDNGAIELREQGGAADLNTGEQVAKLSDEELAVYDRLPALYFQDPNFIPDFPRAAELFDAFWTARYPKTKLDGVVTLDPVGMSYLMAGTGPIKVGETQLTPENVVAELLSTTYLTISDPANQDLRFQEAARAVLAAVTGNLTSPVELVRAVDRAIDEDRLFYAPFDDDEAARLAGQAVLGAIPSEDGDNPVVTVGVNDATGSKMSFYLRHRGKVTARSCDSASEIQQLEGQITLSQIISPAEAGNLPDYVTGGAAFGIPVGNQLVTLRIYGPAGGTITDVRLNGVPLLPEEGLLIAGRPVVTASVLLETVEDSLLTWRMTTGPGQIGQGRMNLTPGVEPGSLDSSFASACN